MRQEEDATHIEQHRLNSHEGHSTKYPGLHVNVAECELAVLATQCLYRRLPACLPTVQREAAAWETGRNARDPTVKWQFTTAQARCERGPLYPYKGSPKARRSKRFALGFLGCSASGRHRRGNRSSFRPLA